MTDYIKIASDIIQDGNLNKLNTLLTMKMTEELSQTLRRIFQYLVKSGMFVINYSNEWQAWYPKNYKCSFASQVDQFLNTKFSVYLRILFQNNLYAELIEAIEISYQSPPYRRLVELSFTKEVGITYDALYFKVASEFDIEFDAFIELLKRIPDIECKTEYSDFIQSKFPKIQESFDNQLKFTKIVNSHVVDKVDNPLLLANFLERQFNNYHIELKIYSLQALLVLISKHHYNLDGFYEKLIDLIGAPEAIKQSRLLKLIDVAARSSKVSMDLLKRILRTTLRICLKESCSLQLWAVSLTFNVIKKNPSIQINTITELASYQHHWHPEIKRIVSYLPQNLDTFDFFILNDLIELTDAQMFEAYLEM